MKRPSWINWHTAAQILKPCVIFLALASVLGWGQEYGITPTYVVISPTQCIYGPWDFMIPNADGSWGEFSGGSASFICVESISSIHLAQIVTGDVLIWADDGHVWPIASPAVRYWWEAYPVMYNVRSD
jgi:hypothetical protein